MTSDVDAQSLVSFNLLKTMIMLVPVSSPSESVFYTEKRF